MKSSKFADSKYVFELFISALDQKLQFFKVGLNGPKWLKVGKMDPDRFYYKSNFVLFAIY